MLKKIFQAGLLAILLSTTAQADQGDDVQRQLNSLQGDIAQMHKLLDAIRQQRNEAQQDLGRSEKDIGQLHGKIKDIEKRLLEGQQQLKKLQTDQRQLVSQINAQKQAVTIALRALHRNGQQAYIKLLLNQQSPERSARMLHLFARLNTQQQAQIKNFNADLQTLEALKLQISEGQLTLKQRRNTLAAEQSKLKASQKQRSRLVSQLSSSFKGKGKQLKRLKQDEAELKQILYELQNAIADIDVPGTPFAKARKHMPRPVKGKLKHRFHSKRADTGTARKGVFFSANAGDEVRAIHHGRVVFADWLRGFGLLIIIDHGDQYLSLYAHNQSLLKENGEWLQAGEALATVGNSGGQSESGLYFEIRHRGKALDPFRCCLK